MLVCVLVYMPPVQKFAVRKASEMIYRETGMHLSVERFRLRFPAGVSLQGATVITPAGDTLVSVGSSKTSVRLIPLVSGRIVARGISLENVRSTWRDTVSGLVMRAGLADFSARRAILDFKDKSVRVPRVILDRADIALVSGTGGHVDSLPDKTPSDSLPAWNIEVGRLGLSDSRFAMDIPSLPASSLAGSAVAVAFDPEHIRADSVNLDVRDFRFADGDISLVLRELKFVERSGLQLTHGEGEFAMTPDEFTLNDFALTTAHSHIEVDARVGSGIVETDAATPVSLALAANVAAGEMLLFVPTHALDPKSRRVLQNKNLKIEASAFGTIGDVTIEKLTAHLPGSVDVDISGRLSSLTALENISGNATFKGKLGELDFVKNFISDPALRSRIAIPSGIEFQGEGTFSPDVYELSAFNLTSGAGRLDAKGHLALREKNYAAVVRVTDFPVADFLPGDSLGAATLSLTARGHGFDPAGDMRARAALWVGRLDYGSTDLGRITANLTADNGDIEGKITSRSELLATDITLGARVERDSLPSASGGAASPLRYTVSALVDSTVLHVGDKIYNISSTALTASASEAGSAATLRSGDFTLDMLSPMGLDSLIVAAGSISGEVSRQLAARHFSADSLQSAFPPLTLTVKAGRDNPLRGIAVMHGVDFYSIAADVSTTLGTPFSIDGTVKGFNAASLTLDTLGFHAHRNANNLDYSLRMTGRPSEDNDNLGLIEVSGSAGGNSLSANVFQRNRSDSIGFSFGIRASLAGKVLHAEMTPADPILGYERWAVESGADWIEYETDGTFRGNLRLSGPRVNEYARLTSASLPDIPEGALRLEMAGLPIAPMLDLLPTAPPLDGTAFSDITFGLIDGWTRPQRGPDSNPPAGLAGRFVRDTTRRAAIRGLWSARREATDSSVTGKIIAAKGSVGAGDFSYNGRRVADIDATVDFRSDTEARMRLTADVSLDRKTALVARGFYSARAMNLTVGIPAVPLSIAEGFLPAGAAALSGNLDGELRITGVPTAPVISGDFGVSDGRADVEMTGTGFGISSDRITIADNIISFNNFGITSSGNRQLTFGGKVDISDLSHPSADVRMSANNFQVVNSKHIGGSQIYGNAAFNADITAKGTLSGMTVRGNVGISPTTSIVYILRNRSQVKDEKQHIVEFKVFADSIFDYGVDTLPRFGRPKIDMLVGVNIPEGVKATLSLDELNENRVELVGGGTLSYSMNTQGDVRLAGRYTLSGGTLYYRPPVIPQKVFAVENGSYVEWTGDAAKPQFHVTATQTSDITLDYDDGSSGRAKFDISIDISGSLAAIDMSFDVAAPGDLAIQNQLLAMSREQRMQQALTLLVYGQYTGPGVSSQKKGAFDARATLNNFISKEVNQWARNNLKGVDLSMGIDTRNNGAGRSHTDYSYSVSKSLFNDRVKVSIGGSVADNATSQNFADNLLDDVMLEYRLDERDNMLLKLYRTGTRESILEGEVTETGVGFVMRKKINRFKDLFRRNKSRQNTKKDDW